MTKVIFLLDPIIQMDMLFSTLICFKVDLVVPCGATFTDKNEETYKERIYRGYTE